MKRIVLLLILAAAVAFGVCYVRRGHSPLAAATPSQVTSLLPRETLAFVHLPDFSRTRAQWHESDLYKLWREPAVQEFLAKPLAQTPNAGKAQRKILQLDELQMKDAFLAIISWENKQLKMLGGFRFKGSPADAEKVVGGWRARAQEHAPTAKRETVTHGQHQIEVMTRDEITIATVYASDWFFAANDLPSLQALLDRADKRVRDAATTLTADEDFTAALKQMPAGYAVLGYGRVDRYAEKLASTLPPDSANAEQLASLRKVRSIMGASAFENGKIRDVLFVGMPEIKQLAPLQRSSLGIGTKDTFLYLASALALSNQAGLQNMVAAGANLPGALQSMLGAFSGTGLTLEDWNAAFGPEISLLGDWVENGRTPSLFATLPVKDAAKARAIAAALTTRAGETEWVATEREDVQYLTLPPSNPMVPVSPTLAIGKNILILAPDPAAAEAATKRASSSESELAGTKNFRTAEGLVPSATQAFLYVDPALLYTRLDTAVRPMLIMAAAFMPKIAETVDLGKLPAAEVITRHLSPLVLSQSFKGDGYLTSSIGPVSAYQAVLGAATMSGLGAAFYQRQRQDGTGGPASSAAPPDPEPDETPEPGETPESGETPGPEETPEPEDEQ